jgi:hypothetical protein
VVFESCVAFTRCSLYFQLLLGKYCHYLVVVVWLTNRRGSGLATVFIRLTYNKLKTISIPQLSLNRSLVRHFTFTGYVYLYCNNYSLELCPVPPFWPLAWLLCPVTNFLTDWLAHHPVTNFNGPLPSNRLTSGILLAFCILYKGLQKKAYTPPE